MEHDSNSSNGGATPPWHSSAPERLGSAARRDNGRSNFRARAETQRDRGCRVAPRASLAARTVSFRSKGSFRGTIISPLDNREINYESVLERDAAYILLADPRVTELREQVGPVKFFADDGSRREHYFDFVATLRDGTRHAIAVKYERDVDRTGIRDDLARIGQQADDATRVLLRTERHVTRVRAENARLVLHANRMADPADVAALQRFLASVSGVATLADILQGAGLCSPGGFYAAARLFGLGLIKCVDGGAFCHDARVRVIRAKSAK